MALPACPKQTAYKTAALLGSWLREFGLQPELAAPDKLIFVHDAPSSSLLSNWKPIRNSKGVEEPG